MASVTTTNTDFVCPECSKVCKNKGGLSLHRRKAHSVIPVTQQSVPVTEIHPPCGNTTQTVRRGKQVNATKSFCEDVTWAELNIPEETYFKCSVNVPQGIVDMFAHLHTQEHHDNIKWKGDKLLAFDGNTWCEVNDNIMAKHLGFIFGILEERWCDYQTSVRCGCDSIIDEEQANGIDTFYYDDIVDDDSLMFYCKDSLYSYLHTLKY